MSKSARDYRPRTAHDDELRQPPHSINAEQSVLGALLLDNSTAKRINGDLAARDFYTTVHRDIFDATVTVISNDQRADVITVAEQLESRGKLDQVGGVEYLGSLVENVPSAAGAPRYAAIVREHAKRRSLAALAASTYQAALAPGSDEVAALIATLQAELEGLVSAHDDDALRAVDLAAMAASPVPTRKWRADGIMPAGVPGVWTGHGGAGKTQGAIALALSLATGKPFFGVPVIRSRVAFVSTEDSRDELHIRLAAQCATCCVELGELDGWLFLYDAPHTGTGRTLLATGDDAAVAPTAFYQRLRARLRHQAVDVVILDNWSTIAGVDGNRPDQVTAAIGLLGGLVRDGGNTVILAHVDKLTAKGGYSREAYSGSAAFHNRSRWRWFMFAPDRDEDATDPSSSTANVEDDGGRILEVQKVNAGRVGTRIALRLVVDPGPAQGAIIAEPTRDGLISSIERRNEERWLLAQLSRAEDAGDPIYSSRTANLNAYERLSIVDDFPKSFKGRSGRRLMFRTILQLKEMGAIVETTGKNASRHAVGVWNVTETGRRTA